MRQYIIALYIRFSLEDTKTESLSIRNQRIYLLDHAMTLPEYDNAEILEFIDNGHSGANFERPAVQELLDMVRAGKVDCILVKDFSRFGRNSIETGYFIERVFPIFHTRFISVGDDFDSANYKGDTGGLNVAFKYLISECYSRDMSMKTKTAKYAKMRRGEYQSKICPYGYQKGTDGRMEPDPETAPVVRQIFHLAAEGLSSAAIARKLHEQGIPTPGEYKVRKGIASYDVSRTGGVWLRSTVLRILEDERYVGTYIIGKRTVTEIGGHRVRRKDESEWHKIPDHHPAIVEKEVFEQVQATARRFSLSSKKTHEYPLRRKVICGLCGHALTRESNKVYRCRRSHSISSSPCHDQRIRASDLERLVYEIVSKQLEVLSGADAVEIGEKLETRLERKAGFVEQIAQINDDKKLLFERLMRGEIDNDTYASKNTEYTAALLRVKNTLALASVQARDAQKAHDETVKRQAVMQEVSGEKELTQTLADTLIEKVIVYPGNRVEIAYKVKGDFSA